MEVKPIPNCEQKRFFYPMFLFYCNRWDYDYLTSTYFLLLERKHKGLIVRLTPGNNSPNTGTMDQHTPKRNLFNEQQNIKSGLIDQPNLVNIELSSPTPISKTSQQNGLADSPRGLHNSLEGGLDDIDLLKIGHNSIMSPTTNNGPLDRTKNRASERYHVPHKKTIKNEQQQNSPYSYVDPEDKENSKPAQMINQRLHSHQVTADRNSTPKAIKNSKGMSNSPLSPSRSMDSGLNQGGPFNKHKLANREGSDWVFATPEKPAPISKSGSVSNRKVLGSIERGLGKLLFFFL